MLSSLGVFWRPGATRKDKWYAVASIVGTVYFMSLTTFVIYLSVFEIMPVAFLHSRDTVVYHSICLLYLFLNVLGNFANAHGVDTSISALPQDLLKAGRQHWDGWCKTCRARIPRRCHHCILCDKCVMKRDHHCFFIGTCVGYANQKYFVCFLFYTFVAGLYCTVLQAIYLNHKYQVPFQGTSTLVSLIPSTLYHWLYLGDISHYQGFLVLIFYGSFFSGLLSGSFFFWQMYIIYRGQTQWEARMHIDCYSGTFKENFLDAFGTYWPLTFLLPLPLPQPGHGIYQDQYEDDDSSTEEELDKPSPGLRKTRSYGGFLTDLPNGSSPHRNSPIIHRNSSFNALFRANGTVKRNSLHGTPSPKSKRSGKTIKKVIKAKMT